MTYALLKPWAAVAALGGAGVVFAVRMGRLGALMRAVGGPARIPGGGARTRVVALVREVLLHARMLRVPAIGAAHLGIFAGFLAIQIHTSEVFLEGLMPGFSYARFAPRVYAGYRLITDVLAALVLAGLGYAFLRRWRARPATLSDHLDARLVLLFTAVIIVTYFGLNVSTGDSIGPSTGLRASREAWWWAHVAVILGFLVYLPGSKHLHILTAIPNILLNASGAGRPLSTPDLEGGAAPGVGTIADLSWKQVLDVVTCTECGRCEAVCPASLTGKALSPKRVIVDARAELRRRAGTILANRRAGKPPGEGLPALVRPESGITEEVLYACTTCRACEEACPVGIRHLDLIVDARRHLVLMEGRFPPELQQTFTNLENTSNPWGFPPESRDAWAAGLGVPTLAERPDAPVLYFVGCAGSFDDRAKRTAAAVANLLKKAGVDFAILGKEETCTGDPARRAGNEYLAQRLLRRTAETLARATPRTILTACPHCLNALRNEAGTFGVVLSVVHHAEYLADLARAGRLRPKPGAPPLDVVIHDSCYLGRWNDDVTSAREALAAIPGVTVQEPPRHGRNGLCCGAGGGRVFMEEHGSRTINGERAGELAATGATVAAVACPFCATMLSDGMRARGAGPEVKDVAVLLDEATSGI